MLTSLRRDLGLDDVPILLGGLGDYLADYPNSSEGFLNYPIINRALQAVAQTREMAGFVSAEGLQSNPDYLPFNTKSLYEFGLRYFAEYEKLNVNCSDVTQSDTARSEMELL